MRVQQTRWSLKKILTCSALTGEEGRVGRGMVFWKTNERGFDCIETLGLI